MQIKVKSLEQQKQLLTSLSRRAPLDSFIIFYHGLNLMAEILGNSESC